MKNINEIIPCVILAGGKGRRMGGKEKGLINLLDRPLMSYVLEKVSGKAAPIALNINTNFEKFRNFGYEILEDPLKGHLGYTCETSRSNIDRKSKREKNDYC